MAKTREAKARVAARVTSKVRKTFETAPRVSNPKCRLCGEEGHWEEDCPQADVDMSQAKRRVTFPRPPVGVGVSQAWGVETWTVSPSTESAETRLKTWTSQEIQESTNLMGVRWQLLGQLRPSPRLEKHVALQLWTKFNASSLEVVAILWKRRLL